MFNYVIRRLILLPITLFFIVLVNFVIVNLAPGEPVTISEITPEGAMKREDQSAAFGSDERYLLFREFYGLTLPVLWNTWPWISESQVQKTLWRLVHRKYTPEDIKQMPYTDYQEIKTTFGDQARFIMPLLLNILETSKDPAIQRMAMRFLIRGGTRQGTVGPSISEEQKQANKKIAKDNQFLRTLTIQPTDSENEVQNKILQMHTWVNENAQLYNFTPTFFQKIGIFFFETRFFRYMSRVVRLDFGTLRNDSNKTVVSEVVKRFKYSLTLSILPMVITFFLCLLLGFTMAYKHNQWQDYTINLTCLILYAIPIFVVAPLLIEKVALNHHFPFTDIPIPFNGFTSPDNIYNKETSWQRLLDIFRHILLPLIAITYGTLAAQARIARTAVLEVLQQDYVRTARAKGVPPFMILFKHVGRNASITIVTSIAGSLGVVLGGSLIVETLFDINGFGKFFYDAVLNRDYNVILFSALAGSFLTLIGYLIADITYTALDPRVSLE